MSVPARLAGFGAALVLLASGGAAVGAAVGPLDVDGGTTEDHTGPHPAATTDGDAPSAPAGTPPAGGAAVEPPVAAVPPPAPGRHVAVDGYDVHLAGDLRTGGSELTFAVSRRGVPVRPEPYLGAAGHLVAVRDGDLADLGVRPLPSDDGPRFAVGFPTPGRYRLFLDFAHDGAVRTAAFTVDVPDPAGDPTPPATRPRRSPSALTTMEVTEP